MSEKEICLKLSKTENHDEFLYMSSLFILAQVERLHFLKYKLHSDTGQEKDIQSPFPGESRESVG